MSDFETFVNRELPRRSPHLTKVITSYDGDPNDGAAPTILQVAPLGTWFREETNAKWWRRTETTWSAGGVAWQVAGAGGMTAGPIVMTVAAGLTGTSPPAGVIVTNQAEYDALGYDLKYPQDAIDILPAVLTDYILINLVPGNHYAKPGSYASAFGLASQLFTAPKLFDTTLARAISTDYPAMFSPATIQFQGSMSVIEAVQAGTSAGSTLTRSAGTWTTNEHRSRFVEIKTGSGSGNRHRITSNNATQLFVVPSLSAGAVTFEVIEPAVKWLNSTDGADTAFGLRLSLLGDAGQVSWVVFDGIDMGSPSKYSGLALAGSGRAFFSNSRFYVNGLSVQPGCGFVLEDCYGEINGFGTTFSPVTLHQSYVRVGGSPIKVYATGDISFYKTYMDAVPAYADFLVQIIGGFVSLTTLPVFDGGGTASGLLVEEATIKGASTTTVNNCVTAIEAAIGARVAMAETTLSGSGNATGFKLSGGAVIGLGTDPAGLSATNEIDIDGEILDYADVLASAGDWVEGKNGSRIHRS